ncbi:MAG TPA: RNA polymerase sigma factor [Polyangiaceae bacterium]|jgi:RNA polymerase sigma-70 factor (ECF subfamily)|nr:RNA polymerase sigma factor [Polyangiaceae bacterium]
MIPPRLTSRQVFDEHARYVLRVLKYLGVREADVPDVSQEVFVTVHRKLAEFEGRSSVRTWLYRICRNAASDHFRRAHVRREIVTDTTAPESVGLDRSRDDGPRAEARSTLAFLLEHLDEAKREVFVLYEVEGMTMNEVCDVLGCKIQTAYSRLHAARAILTDLLADEALEKTS